MSIIELNKIQKIVVSVLLSLLIISIFLHNPLSGYFESHNYDFIENIVADPDCTPEFRKQIRHNITESWKNDNRDINSDTLKTYLKRSLEIRCKKNMPFKVRSSVPIQEMQTKDPIVFWFGKLINIVQLGIVMIFISGIIFYLFKDDKPVQI